MVSFPSVASLPAHLTPGRSPADSPTHPLKRRPSINSLNDPTYPGTRTDSGRRRRRRLPEPQPRFSRILSRSQSTTFLRFPYILIPFLFLFLLVFRYHSPGAAPNHDHPQRRPDPTAPTAEEEDETLAVVLLDEPSTSASGAHWLASARSSFSSTNQRLPSHTPPQSPPAHLHEKGPTQKPSLTARATLGISRWVMKRSGFRVGLDQTPRQHP